VRVTAERRAVITGAGQSQIGRRLGRSVLSLACESAIAAVADAGLAMDDIDGYCAYPGGGIGGPGFAGPASYQVLDSLGVNPDWHASGVEVPGQLGAVMIAAMAVQAGMARHVLVQRTVAEATYGLAGLASQGGSGGGGGIAGDFAFLIPFYAVSPATWLALYAARYMHEYGLTEEQLAWVALNGRRHAARNPHAVFREPLTMEAYLAARVISTPFRLYDCDVPVDGSTSVIVSAADATSGLRHQPAVIEAMGAAMHGRPLWEQWEDLTTTASRDAAAQLWSRTALRPEDVDVAELYDGFSFLTITWLEALGFVERGGAGAFLEGGTATDLDGRLPLNTAGGQLSGGRLHGFGFLAQGCRQLWGQGGDTQVTSEAVDVVAVAAGGAMTCGCLLLRRPD
jgi:acetyl-CoA acetyltransferase